MYDAQAYLLLGGYKSAEEAQTTLTQWKDMAGLQYVVDQTRSETRNGQDFTVITYSSDSGTDPYARGASAYGAYRNYAVSVALTFDPG